MTIHTDVTTDELLGLFPQGTGLDSDGTLTVGGCRLDDVAEKFGTPAIVVSEDALRQRASDYLAAFRGRWPRCDVAFASKSFPCTAVQRIMVEEGLHLDVAGGGEILTALKAGADPAKLVLHGNAKSDEELELAVKNGVGLVVVDNFDDIDRLERIVPAGHQQPCLVRVIPGVEAATHASQATGHAGSKFGLLPDDARDATQTAFIRAYEHLDSYDPGHKFFTWIYRILINECLNILRARRPNEPVSEDLAGERDVHRIDPIDAEKRRKAIQKAILALPVDYRQVIVLRHFAELSYEEIAATVGIPVKTVKSRLFSARQRLGEHLLGWKAT